LPGVRCSRAKASKASHRHLILKRAFAALTSTEELLRLSAPGVLQNASYNLDLIVPVVRSLPSNESVRAWTAAAAFKSALRQSGVLAQKVAGNITFVPNVDNLTYTINELTKRDSERADKFY
jgi:hypothetical protein